MGPAERPQPYGLAITPVQPIGRRSSELLPGAALYSISPPAPCSFGQWLCTLSNAVLDTVGCSPVIPEQWWGDRGVCSTRPSEHGHSLLVQRAGIILLGCGRHL